jgi:hypothetical protein
MDARLALLRVDEMTLVTDTGGAVTTHTIAVIP